MDPDDDDDEAGIFAGADPRQLEDYTDGMRKKQERVYRL